MIEDAGFGVSVSCDMFEGAKCWAARRTISVRSGFEYEGPERDLFRRGKQALDAARGAGVFTVGMFVAAKASAH